MKSTGSERTERVGQRPQRRAWGRPRRGRGAWAAFALASLAGIAAMAWASVAVVRLESDERAARAESERAQAIRLALWRMDSWLAPRLAAESTRPYFHYLSLYPSRRTYGEFLDPIEPGESLAISPLMAFEDEVIRLHVQVDARGTISSPQAPEDDFWLLAVAGVPAERIAAARDALASARRVLSRVPLVARVDFAASCQTAQFESARAIVLGRADALAGPDADSSGTQVAALPAPAPTAPVSTAAGPVEALQFDNRIADARKEAGAGLAPELRARGLEHPARAAPSDRDSSTTPAAARGTDQDARADAAHGGGRGGDAAMPRSEATNEPSLAQRRQMASSAEEDFAKRVVTSGPGQFAGSRQQRVEPIGAAVDVGPFVPIWIELPGAHEGDAPDRTLWYFRTVRVGAESLVQGFEVAWPSLCAALRAQVVDLLPAAELVPSQTPDAPGAGGLATGPTPQGSGDADVTRGSGADGDHGQLRLASVPAHVLPGPTRPSEDPGLRPARVALGAAWLGLLGAIAGAGLTLRAVRADAERRARFAGTVTHELRTPLTTFQLYAEMLADGMVPPERRTQYLETLRTESHRLGSLVENVLSYARIEQGRHVPRREGIDTAGLLARLVPPLQRRAREAGVELAVEGPEAVDRRDPWSLDIESVERILANLVDNAAKYAVHERAGDVASGKAFGGARSGAGDGRWGSVDHPDVAGGSAASSGEVCASAEAAETDRISGANGALPADGTAGPTATIDAPGTVETRGANDLREGCAVNEADLGAPAVFGGASAAPAGSASGGAASPDAATPSGGAGPRINGNGRAHVVLRIEPRRDRLDLLVVDRGPGIAPALAARLFRPFERGGDDLTGEIRGIGLGLALSRELARAMRGDLTLEPTPGGGATFRLRLDAV
ncbi:MAG TPA: HAMP domain-containing sensor histidine kinase [Phycisphaerales bacterium]|nr:HAMP domain-containing sensor histidine kinase [Phycisphaerales bacterium]HMP38004.1 HAMP domain-containing sensor histidine kinase [Phycisphaerales bacterium]